MLNDDRTTKAVLSSLRDTKVGQMATLPLRGEGKGRNWQGEEGGWDPPRDCTFPLFTSSATALPSGVAGDEIETPLWKQNAAWLDCWLETGYPVMYEEPSSCRVPFGPHAAG